MRTILMLVLLLVGCTNPPQATAFEGLIPRPDYAVAMQQLGSDGQPLRTYDGEYEESYAIPNEYRDPFLQDIHDALLEQQFVMYQDDQFAEKRRRVYFTEQERVVVSLDYVSFDKTMFTFDRDPVPPQ